MDLKKTGEFGLLNKLRSKIRRHSKNIKIGVGDDCAVVAVSGSDMLFTTDILIENVHFDLKYFSPEKLGEKAITINLSDIAAMGGTPLYILISLGIPASTSVEFIEKLYQGFASMAKKYKCSIIGGDISKSIEGLIISINIIGEVEKNTFVRRSGAKIKDKIFVTGDIGDSAAGLELLRRANNKKRQAAANKWSYRSGEQTKNSSPKEKLFQCNSMKNKLIEKHLSPKPRLKEGQILAQEIGVSAMIDLSDGLASDLRRICEESKCGARIYLNKLPLSINLRKMGKSTNENIFNYAILGGEDYELLFTIEKKRVERLQKQWQNMNISFTNIGEILEKKDGITLVHSDGKEEPLLKRGYDHFKNN